MKKFIAFIILFTVAGCAQYEPLVDLRSSKAEAQFYQRDLNECRMLAASARGWIDKALISDSPMVSKCLEGRGHTVLNQ